MKLRLDYGAEGLEVKVPDDAHVVDMEDTPGLNAIEQHIEQALLHPVGTPSLRRLAQNRRSACVAASGSSDCVRIS